MQSYLEKQAFMDLMIKDRTADDLIAVIVIPSYNEMDLLKSIHALLACEPVKGTVEILPVLNSRESDDPSVDDLHSEQHEEIRQLSKLHSNGKFRLHAVKPIKLPDKIAGVGLARKLGMDEAVRRFESLCRDGLIINFDADCLCTPDYLQQIVECAEKNPGYSAISIGFQHRLDGLNEAERHAILLYELHLRSYIGWQKQFGYPFAFQTLGSCFAVKSKAYQAQGGMNKRKAGEDFYFLHKFSILGELGELNKALVLPSGRISHRVPFGTGRSVYDIIHTKKIFKTYNPVAIESFCLFLNAVSNSFHSFKRNGNWHELNCANSLKQFLISNSFDDALHSAINNSATTETFQKRISRWFDPFRLMKYLHFARGSEFEDQDVLETAHHLVQVLVKKQAVAYRAVDLLNMLRGIAYPDEGSMGLE